MQPVAPMKVFIFYSFLLFGFQSIEAQYFLPFINLTYDELSKAQQLENMTLQSEIVNFNEIQTRKFVAGEVSVLKSKQATLNKQVKVMAPTVNGDFFDYCDRQIPDRNRAWFVIQRRVDGSGNFSRSWSEYVEGFGNQRREFFLGLKKLHMLTNSRPHELLVLLEDFDRVKACAKYDKFVIGNESEKYKIKVLGAYFGNAGNCLQHHRGIAFSTFDRDNDRMGRNCPNKEGGGWWFNYCQYCNLHGRYLSGIIKRPKALGRGVNWYYFRGDRYSLKFAQMMLRPKI